MQSWLDRDPLFARANIEFDGVACQCHMACVPEAKVGDYVIVHAGVAICLIDEMEARRIFAELERLDLLDERLESDGLA
ncbi:MAG: HypC/HybG/HupF family hydrogenase formation chaperone [Pirellulaceae bacterium]